MKTKLFTSIVAVLSISLLIAVFATPSSEAKQMNSSSSTGTTEKVSIATDGTQANNDSYLGLAISSDGRYIAFSSLASNLVTGDTNSAFDVFVRDRLTGETTRVSVATDGSEANASSAMGVSISADGRYVVFQSFASNLVLDDTNNNYDVFMHDRIMGVTTRVSVASDGSQIHGFSSDPWISADGRYIAFSTNAPDVVSGDTNNVNDAFVYDRVSGNTTRISINSMGIQGNGDTISTAISADGRYIAMQSYATNLVNGDTNDSSDAFVYDQLTGVTKRISISSSGIQGNGWSAPTAISSDGTYVLFDSYATNLIEGDIQDWENAYVHNLVTGVTTRVSITSNGTEGNGNSEGISISANGRYTVFDSDATNLVDEDTNNIRDVFVHDQVTGETLRTSISSSGAQGNGWSGIGTISADGTTIAFESNASNLVFGDSNGYGDVFVSRIQYNCEGVRRGNSATNNMCILPTIVPTPPPVNTHFLDLPVPYDGSEQGFKKALQGNTAVRPVDGNTVGGGKVNSWFDHHENPNNIGKPDGNLTLWNGREMVPGNIHIGLGDCNTHPGGFGISCYDSHNAIDFQMYTSNDDVKPAYTGIVDDVYKAWQPGAAGGSRGHSYGNYVFINHGNGYGTLYAHLAAVSSWVEKGTSITDLNEPIGTIGGTGGWKPHLHFGVYYDPSPSPTWSERYSEVDPYGWEPYLRCQVDPWPRNNAYLWKYHTNNAYAVGSNGGIALSPIGTSLLSVPNGALSSEVTLEMMEAPPAAASLPPLRFVGYSLWPQILEWQQSCDASSKTSIPITNAFAKPITVTMFYLEDDLAHYVEANMKIFRWDETNGEWDVLTTTVDMNSRRLMAQTTTVGNFTMQAPLICPSDTTEPSNDSVSGATTITSLRPFTQLFDTASDHDWLQFQASTSTTYTITTSALGVGADTILDLYDSDGTTILLTDDNGSGGLASKITWQATNDGTYYIKVTNKATSVTGCSATYQVRLDGQPMQLLYLPLILR